MATSDWNSIDNFEENFPSYNCAFLDILGYKERVSSYFSSDFNLYGRIERALEAAMTCMELTSLLVDSRKLQVEIVSDSIVMTQPANGDRLGILLPFTCHLASSLSFEGLLIRGGIARGSHSCKQTKHGFDFLASEALSKAYLLESEQAIYPRILVDQAIAPDLPREELQILVRENEDYIVDFAHHIINRNASNVDFVLAEMTELQEEKDRIPSERVKEKYQWLLDYYCWTISQNPKWDYSIFEGFASDIDHRFEYPIS